jgi:cholesterol oxidase
MSRRAALGTPEHFDALIVGSGFGGAVTAARLAEAGWRVCVLERGKAYPPGSFPRSPLGMKRNFWDPSEGLHGLFDLWSFDGIDALVASGLGGGSLVYANVFLRKDEKWFVNEDLANGGYEDWPVTRADLDPHYDVVERRIGVQRYPFEKSPYDKTPKVIAFKHAAESLGLDWELVPLAVTFANDNAEPVPGEPIVGELPNLHGRTRLTCRMCGECDAGCNYGSKNTLDYNYLSDAERAGADLRTLSEVRAFEPLEGGGYQVHYVVHEAGVAGSTEKLPAHTITCSHLVLAAGALGTTRLMMRNRAALPGLSGALGHGYSGNGDLLTIAMRCSEQVDGKRVPRVIESSQGAVITSAIRIPDALDGGEGRGFYLEDAGYPDFASWILEVIEQPVALVEAAPKVARWVWSMVRGERDTEVGKLASAMLGDCELSSTLMPLLGMGRDVPDGVMTLNKKLLELDWSKDRGSKPYFDRVREFQRRLAHAVGGDPIDNPIWHLNRVITAHSLGGCRMGRNQKLGVVDSHGRVFGHPGLHIADGSVMPGPVGPNPSLTIAALADRFADAILTEPHGASVSIPADVPADAPAREAEDEDAVAVSFTEEMKGFVAFGEPDYESGARAGKEAGNAFMFHLTITVDDVERFIADPMHTGRAEGWIECDALGGRLPVTDGVFNLFVDEPTPGSKRMLYRLPFADGEGHPLTMTGFKEVIHGHMLELWQETTTLYTRVLTGHVRPEGDAAAEVLAGGIIYIHLLDFAKQMTTIRVDPPDRIDGIARFGALFAGELWSVYGPNGARAQPVGAG